MTHGRAALVRICLLRNLCIYTVNLAETNPPTFSSGPSVGVVDPEWFSLDPDPTFQPFRIGIVSFKQG